MTSWKNWLENKIANLSLAIINKPKLSLLLFLVVFIGFSQNLRNVEFDPEMENFVSETSPVRIDYNLVKEAFGRNDIVMLGLRGDVLSTQFITDLQELHSRLETEVRYANDVTSIVNAPYQKGTEDSLLVLDLIEKTPENEADLAQIEQRIQESTMASSILVNEARTMTLVMVEPATYDYGSSANADPFATDNFDDAFSDDAFSTDAFSADVNTASTVEEAVPFVTQFQLMDMIADIEVIMADYPQLEPIMAGMPAMNVQLEGTMKDEMVFFLQITLALIILTLLLFFRQLSAVVAPIIAVMAGLLLTMGIYVLAGNKIQIPLVLLPTFLLAVTIGDAVHLLTHFYQRIQLGEERKTAMHVAVQNTSIPMLLTSLTTAGGLMSLSIAEVVPIRNLGIYAGLGVMIAFLLTVTVIPALIMVLPLKQPKNTNSQTAFSKLIESLAAFSWRHGGKIALIWLVAGLLALTQVVKLQFSHDPLNWMPADLDIVKSTQIIDDELSGTMTMDIVFDTGVVNGAKDIAFLKRMGAWQEELEAYSKGNVEVKGVNSIIDVIKESNRALQGGGTEFYALPDSQALLNEEIFLFENSAADQLYQLVDSDFQKARMTLVLPWSDLMFYQDFVIELQERGDELFEGAADVTVTGMMALLAGTMVALIYSAAFSYIIAAVVIAIMMMILLSSARLGLIAMIPNIAPILVVMGLMYPMGIELDMLTILVATIAIGIAVDNTVHFTHHFRRGLEKGHNLRAAMDDAFSGAGQALFTTCVVLSIGFYVFLFSEVSSIFNLGFLCGTSFVLAMISNFTLTPYLLRWYYRNHDAAVS
ncbi:efflux RND transporter permease subunit [Reinekea sp.]|jgi:predicted RND superfamily exporter protein|uniref:efflux RND transporter permease subunit n=1 Tax=Reinekea sp. TaxID=1970455 RepID=UPI0039893D8D